MFLVFPQMNTSLQDSSFTCPFSGRKMLSQEDMKEYVTMYGFKAVGLLILKVM